MGLNQSIEKRRMMTSNRQGPELEEAGVPVPPPGEYAPPQAEDIDTTLGPAETAAGVPQSIHPGVEESSRWH
jgi:hypothetical protein